jgi:hypothetical protein
MRVIILLVQSDEQIPHTYATTVQQLVTQIKSTWFGTLQIPLLQISFAAIEWHIYYLVFAHTSPETRSSSAANTPDMDSLVTWVFGGLRDPATGHSVETRDQQSGTCVREFGHTLGLRHDSN